MVVKRRAARHGEVRVPAAVRCVTSPVKPRLNPSAGAASRALFTTTPLAAVFRNIARESLPRPGEKNLAVCGAGSMWSCAASECFKKHP